jgi:uncharacterized protein
MSRGSAKDIAAIVSAAGEIVGRTRLQKTGVMLELMGLGFGFSYDYHLFGPFSEEVVVSSDRAVALGYINEDIRRSSWGGIYSIFRAEKRSSGSLARDEAIRIAAQADSIVLELTATAAFLAAQGVEDPWSEVALRKPEKITRARLSQAKALYRQFASVDSPQRLPALS